MQKLVGQWMRTDSPYVIEIHEVSPDGTLRAGYFNPRPINVAAAKAQNKDGKLQVFVELRDTGYTGYPGSTYTLNYDPKEDALKGTYFQATMQQNYDVAFMAIYQGGRRCGGGCLHGWTGLGPGGQRRFDGRGMGP